METKVVHLNNVIDNYTYSEKKLINIKDFVLFIMMKPKNVYSGGIAYIVGELHTFGS